MIAIEPHRDADLPTIRTLMRRYADGIPVDLAYQRFDAELAALPSPYIRPDGLLLVARDDAEGVLVGIGAYRPIRDGIAEIKRLYVSPDGRGQGLGRRLLQTLVDEAARAGHRRIRLDSHRPTMHAAISLYRSLGFEEIAPYGPNPGGEIVFFERPLSPR